MSADAGALRSLLGLIAEDESAIKLAREGGHAFVSSSLRPYLIAAMSELRSRDPGFSPSFMVIGSTSGGMSFGEAFFRSLPASGDSQRPPSVRRAPRAAWLANYPPQKPILDAQAESSLERKWVKA